MAARRLVSRLASLAVAAGLAALAACETAPPAPRLVLAPRQLRRSPGLDVGSPRRGAGRACGGRARGCSACRIRASSGPAPWPAPRARWRAPCEEALRLDPNGHAAARAFFERAFAPSPPPTTTTPTASSPATTSPSCAARARRAAATRCRSTAARPIWSSSISASSAPNGAAQRITGRVNDGRLRPYPTRAEIEAGALDGPRPRDGLGRRSGRRLLPADPGLRA